MTVQDIIQVVFVANREATMTLEGTVINGQIVLDKPQTLPEGAKVKVEIRQLREPRNEWERLLRSAASDCGVSLPDSALSREELYD